jgi:hypothetical protein
LGDGAGYSGRHGEKRFAFVAVAACAAGPGADEKRAHWFF